MGGAIERKEAGLGGPFPLRFPVGKTTAFILAAALTPLWSTVSQLRTPALQQFYSGTYWMSFRDSYHTGRDGQPVTVVYPIQIEQGPLGPSLATVEDADRLPERLRVEDRAVNPKLFHAWLRDQVYHGSALNIYGFLVAAVTITFLVLLMVGANVDRRRRLSALEGAHRRGTKGVSWQNFNRAELGPLWLLWMILFWRGRLHAPKMRQAMERGRRYAAAPACYQAAAGNTAKLLRFCGLRWPGAEGPGVCIEIGKAARIVISEELLAYHLNIFGGTGRGKSTIVRNLLLQIRARGETFVVNDPKREFYRELYRPGIDWAIDPRLEECPYVAIEDEAADELEAESWATSFFPDQVRSNPFFVDKPRAIFAYLMSRYSAQNAPLDMATCSRLGEWLAAGEGEILRRVKGSEFYKDLNRGGNSGEIVVSDMSQSLYATLSKVARVMRMMPASPEGRRRFSVKEWAKKREGCIFLCSEPLTQAAVMRIHAPIADMAILHTQAEVRDRDVPRVWFVLDEVATMGRIGQLESGMTKQRASGNPIVLGCHDLPQLEERYGEKGAETITGQAFTNIVLGSGSEKEAGHIERMIGHEEIDRVTENRPWHLMLFNKGHRARSITNQVTTTAPVTAAEIKALPRFEGYALQEGRVLHFGLRRPNKESVQITEPVERIIPPLVFAEQELEMENENFVVCPVDDPQSEPFLFFGDLLKEQDEAEPVASYLQC
jgi:hypothetical protein